MVEYKLLCQTMYNSACGFYTTYGISAFSDNKRIYSIGDISTDKDSVLLLITKFNENKLEVCHLREAVDDFLYDLRVD